MVNGAATATDPSALESEVWHRLIRERTGLQFTHGRKDMLLRSIQSRMRAVGASSYLHYYNRVAFGPLSGREWRELLRLLLNHETSFFRHEPSFRVLMSDLLPRLQRDRRLRGWGDIRLWSAGCSTGEEAYSLAMAALVVLGDGTPRPRVLGTDLDESVLEFARTGVYAPREALSCPKPIRERYLRPRGSTESPAGFRVCDRVRQLTRFTSINLRESGPLAVVPQDVIFCQNVLIYFDTEDRLDTVRRLGERLRPGGYLVLGPSDLIGQRVPSLTQERLGDTLVFRKES